MRINQYVAAASGLSRRAADQAITDERVTVNGQPGVVGQTIAAAAVVRLDGETLRLPSAYRYLILNKPVGYVTSRTQQGSDPTVYELLDQADHDLRPVGRLDRDSSGLLLFSDDGAFIHRHTHPANGQAKFYELRLDQPLAPADQDRLEHGVALSDGPSRLEVTRSQGRDVTVRLGEGRNRQIRRTLGALGYRIERLHRTAVGPYRLGALEPGAWIMIKPISGETNGPEATAEGGV